MAARLDAPVLGAFGSSYANPPKWQVTTSWRYQRSDRHFRGTEEEEDRKAENSEVINTIHLAEVAVRYAVNDRWSLSLGVPYLMADRSSPIRNDDDEVIDRTVTHASGIGDITLTARRWMLEPATHPNANLSLGFGIKLPTGEKGVQDARQRFEDGKIVTEIQTVDQSIQPGDGGFGGIFDIQGFKRTKGGRATLYGSATYLFNPEGTDRVLTFRSRETEKYMSIADQYLGRIGASFTGPGWNGWSVGIGGRIEGVPVHDVFGSSLWFRRPGYAVSAEPTFGWSGGPHSVSVAIPVAVQRNRQQSVPDKLSSPQRHGDAAFADWVLLVSYTYRFGKSVKSPAAEKAGDEAFEAAALGDRGPFDTAVCGDPAFRVKMARFERAYEAFQ